MENDAAAASFQWNFTECGHPSRRGLLRMRAGVFLAQKPKPHGEEWPAGPRLEPWRKFRSSMRQRVGGLRIDLAVAGPHQLAEIVLRHGDRRIFCRLARFHALLD